MFNLKFGVSNYFSFYKLFCEIKLIFLLRNLNLKLRDVNLNSLNFYKKWEKKSKEKEI